MFQDVGLRSKRDNIGQLFSFDSRLSSLTPSVLDSGQFISHALDVPVCPQADAHTADSLQLGCGYLLGGDIPLEAD